MILAIRSAIWNGWVDREMALSLATVRFIYVLLDTFDKKKINNFDWSDFVYNYKVHWSLNYIENDIFFSCFFHLSRKIIVSDAANR